MTNSDTQQWLDSLPENQQSLLLRLREMVRASHDDIVEEFKWSRPCYSINGELFCYLHAAKNHVTIGFHKGVELSDPQQLLEGEGKGMRHIKVRSADDVHEKAIGELIRQAVSK